MTPEERVQEPLLFWVARQKLRGYQPTAAGIAARQAELIAQLLNSDGLAGMAATPNGPTAAMGPPPS